MKIDHKDKRYQFWSNFNIKQQEMNNNECQYPHYIHDHQETEALQSKGIQRDSKDTTKSEKIWLIWINIKTGPGEAILHKQLDKTSPQLLAVIWTHRYGKRPQ